VPTIPICLNINSVYPYRNGNILNGCQKNNNYERTLRFERPLPISIFSDLKI